MAKYRKSFIVTVTLDRPLWPTEIMKALRNSFSVVLMAFGGKVYKIEKVTVRPLKTEKVNK